MIEKQHIEIPKNCPSCAGELEMINFQLFCRNTLCPAQSSKKVESFATKMKIKGLGPKTVERLNLVDIPELYGLDEGFLVSELGKNGEKIYQNIQQTKVVEFGTFLGALSIPLIGNTAGRKLGEVINSFEEITEANCKKAGLGAKATENLLNWARNNIDYFNLVEFKPKKVSTVVEEKGTVCITGKLNDFKNRTEASNFLRGKGFKVLSGVSKNLDYLVCEDGSSSSKTQKAEQLEIPIVTINQLIGDD